MRQAIEDFGLNPREIPAAALKGDTLGYVEFHIEQGPVLEELGSPARRGRSYCRPKQAGVHVYRQRESCGHDADESRAATRSPAPRSGLSQWSARRCEWRASWRRSAALRRNRAP